MAREIFLSILLFCICFTMAPALPNSKKIILKPGRATFDQTKRLKPLTGQVGAQGLVGGISLSRALPPVSKDLKKGAVFKEASLPKKVAKSGEWYKIPSWMAGKWHREESGRFVTFGWFTWLDTYIDRMDHTWGEQADRFGTVWHRRNEPFIETGDMNNCDFSKVITLQKPVLVSESKVIILYKDTTVEYNKLNHVIIQTYQHEQLSEISRDGDTLSEEVWDKVFDQNGNPTSSGHGRSVNTKISAFQPIGYDEKTRIDLKKDFALYLTTHKLEGLLPTVDDPKLKNKVNESKNASL